MVHTISQFHVGQALSARVLHSEDVVQTKDSNLVFRLLELGLLDEESDSNKAAEGEGVAGDAAATDVAAAAVPSVAWWGETSPKLGEVHRWVDTEEVHMIAVFVDAGQASVLRVYP